MWRKGCTVNNRFLLFIIVIFLTGCYHDDVHTIKDLDETMYDLRAYQENLGDEIKAGKLQDAEWLLEGMDSVFSEIKKKFKEHRKLDAPFSSYYNTKMKKPIRMIRQAIEERDTSLAMSGYKLLVNKCNSCHDDNNIDKDVHF